MQRQAELEFNQLVKLIKKMPKTQWKKLQKEMESPTVAVQDRQSLRNFLLSGPTFSKSQLDKIESARKRIDEWRTV